MIGAVFRCMVLASLPALGAASPAPSTPCLGNRLGMRFVAIPGLSVLFSVWDTRVRDFAAFVHATRYDADAGMYSITADGKWVQRGNTWRRPGFAQTPDDPVVGVSWFDAEAFCRWLTDTERAAGRLAAGQRYRLPTDAEWSVAAGLGGETGATPEERNCRIAGLYPWGRVWPPPDRVGNYADAAAKQAFPRWRTIPGYEDGYVFTSPVGSFPPNRFGLYDMSGEVWQWCQDAYRPGSTHRPLRGGSWGSRDASHLLLSYRDPDRPGPGLRHSDLGFRCVLAPGS